ncbi:MAG: hypothetical protein EHM78_02010 [Myxococcaceae bacterium]|nr:MAG: hypothetical protein EHM78_02010 [Myxococcaceae bacterium]
MSANKLNHPFDEVVIAANDAIARGADVYQKFSCAGCGQRLTMSEANTFFETGSCDKCGVVTDIKKDGCNFLVHAMTPEARAKMEAEKYAGGASGDVHGAEGEAEGGDEKGPAGQD